MPLAAAALERALRLTYGVPLAAMGPGTASGAHALYAHLKPDGVTLPVESTL